MEGWGGGRSGGVRNGDLGNQKDQTNNTYPIVHTFLDVHLENLEVSHHEIEEASLAEFECELSI